MPRGYVGAIAPDDARAFADALAVQTEEAGVAAGGWIERETCVAGVPASLAFTDPMIAERSTSALAGGAVERFPGISIRVWDTRVDRSRAAAPGVGLACQSLPERRRDRHLRARASPSRSRRSGASQRVLLDGVAGVLAAMGARLPRSATCSTASSRRRVTSSCTVARSATTTSPCCSRARAAPGSRRRRRPVVAAGLTTLGDDYVVLDPDGVHVHALYGIVRLEPSSPAAALTSGRARSITRAS